MPPKESYYTIESETHKVEHLGWFVTLADAMEAANRRTTIFPKMIVSEEQLIKITKQAMELLL